MTATTGTTATTGVGGDHDRAYDRLVAVDPVLRGIADAHGRPDPFVWGAYGAVGTSHFAALVLHIVAQQISTSVALILFDRIRSTTGVVEPKSVVALGPERLRSLGLSRAKASYVVNLAEMHLSGALDTEHLDGLDDGAAVAALTSTRGVASGRPRCS